MCETNQYSFEGLKGRKRRGKRRRRRRRRKKEEQKGGREEWTLLSERWKEE